MRINTADLRLDDYRPDSQQIYNGLDCMVTAEVFQKVKAQHNRLSVIYDFERALQAPALEMMLRGFRVDDYERRKAVKDLKSTIYRLDAMLKRYADAVWGKGLNPRSTSQLQDFFYNALHLPEQWISQKGVRKLSMNRETLEKLEVYFHAMPIISCIMAIRDATKQLEVLEKKVDRDGRMRTSYNIAGTETGRWSSSSSAEGTGGNLQNIPPKLRRVFIADAGYKLCGIDLEQAESREIGWRCGVLFDDWSYLDACERGDLHTTTAKLVWPGLGWTGQSGPDRRIAERPFYREFSYRDMAKRGGHGTNYYGTPWTMARHLKVPVRIMEKFQRDYFSAYPCIPKFHQWVAQELQTHQTLSTPFGRERHFFGRPNDDATLREAIAYCGQSPTGDRMNLGLWRIWKHMGKEVQLLAQVHDAVYFQYKETADESAIVRQALNLIQVFLSHRTRSFTIPGEAKTGWNWGIHSTANPDGLKKWTPKTPDTRKRQTLLERAL